LNYGYKANLENKIKMLNDVGVMKKRNPLGGISSYFDSNEEVKDSDALPVKI
jgi:hypothetical protein